MYRGWVLLTQRAATFECLTKLHAGGGAKYPPLHRGAFIEFMPMRRNFLRTERHTNSEHTTDTGMGVLQNGRCVI